MKTMLSIVVAMFIASYISNDLFSADLSSTNLNIIKGPNNLENIKVIKLSSDQHASQFLIFVKKRVRLHRHLSHSESIYVLEGEGDFQLADKAFTISTGDFIQVPENTLHGVIVTSTIPLKVLSIQAPEFFGKDRSYSPTQD